MNYKRIQQLSPEWWALKVGKVSGTRYGQVTSGRKNGLVFELVDEIIKGYIEQDDFTNDDVQFGVDNEPIALDLYEEKCGIKFDRGGVIISDFSDISMASPDAVNIERGIVVEVKCTMDGSKQIERFFIGPETSHMPQIKNYFAQSNDVKEVHWISYCPYTPVRPLVIWIYTRDQFELETIKGRELLKALENEVTDKRTKFEF